MSHPPHLPPKSCSVPLYKKLRMVESVIFVSLMAFFSGLVGGIVSDVYITPEYDDALGVVRESRVISMAQDKAPDALFVRDTYRRTLSLVPRAAFERVGHVVPGTATNAVLLTDTGWFVAPAPASGIQARSWVAVSSDGVAHEIASIVFDVEQGLVYGSLESNGFRVASFPFINAIRPGAGLWIAAHGTLEKTSLSYPEKNTNLSTSYRPGENAFVFRPVDTAPAGSIVWGEDGTFFGFVDNTGAITPWFVVKSVYTRVFAGESIDHKTVPIRGYTITLSEDESALTGGRHGFFVDRVDGVSEIFEPGDIIVHIAGDVLTPWTLDAVVAAQSGSDTTRITLLRDGELIETHIAL